MARNLEPARGFPTFMRALPAIQAARPKAEVLVIGGNGHSYSDKSAHKDGYLGQMREELAGQVDWSRVHFLGEVPYAQFQRIIQISRCHIYLTMPFVLSWSCMEAMSMAATVVASDVAPVREVITHGETGLLVDFFKPEALAGQVVEVLQNPQAYAHLGRNARKRMQERYDFHTVCLPEHLRQIARLMRVPLGDLWLGA